MQTVTKDNHVHLDMRAQIDLAKHDSPHRIVVTHDVDIDRDDASLEVSPDKNKPLSPIT